MPPAVPFPRPLTDECQIGPRIAVNGYARVPSGKRGVWLYAHRVAWEKANGPIPPGAHIHHICGTKACVNPDHLELKSSLREHMKEHPPQRKCDHDDRYIDSRGHSVCRTCQRQNANERYRTDPEFRAKAIAKARAREATLSALGVKRIRVR
jgi:hypothetical protein